MEFNAWRLRDSFTAEHCCLGTAPSDRSLRSRFCFPGPDHLSCPATSLTVSSRSGMYLLKKGEKRQMLCQVNSCCPTEDTFCRNIFVPFYGFSKLSHAFISLWYIYIIASVTVSADCKLWVMLFSSYGLVYLFICLSIWKTGSHVAQADPKTPISLKCIPNWFIY